MSPANPATRPPPPAALAAFLRGVERRAAVLAELQAGDASVGDAAVAAAVRQWHAAAAETPMGDWPGRFWALLLAQPPLHTRVPVTIALDATDRLGELGAGPRAALLLRLAAGLDESTAAAALGVSSSAYGLALRSALPRAADGQLDLQAWHRLRNQVQGRVKSLPPHRLLRLSSAREAVLQGVAADAGASASASATNGGRKWLLTALWSLLALCVLALAATFLPGTPEWLGRDDSETAASVLRELPAASHYGPQAGLVAHRDFAMLADPASPQAQDLAFHSWLAAAPAGDVAGEQAVADPTASASDPVPWRDSDRSESADAPS